MKRSKRLSSYDTRKAIENSNASLYTKNTTDFNEAIRKGNITNDFKNILTQEINQISRERKGVKITSKALNMKNIVNKMPLTFDANLSI